MPTLIPNTLDRFTNSTASARPIPAATTALAAALLLLTTSCGGGKRAQAQDEFFTSGSREADQRASQRMARVEQLEGSESEGAGDAIGDGVDGEQAAPRDQDKTTLFSRLGGEAGMTEIVTDFISRVLEDPRVNWQRLGVQRGLFRQSAATTWAATPENVARLEKHMIQFLSLATGGPARYDGKDLKDSHATLRITNAEFDAVIGDLKASLDRLKIRAREQKELLAIVESTRPQIVTER